MKRDSDSTKKEHRKMLNSYFHYKSIENEKQKNEKAIEAFKRKPYQIGV